jgi:glutathione S-transferase
MLKIIGRKTSSNVQKVLWACGEMGVPYDRQDAGLQFGVVNTADYIAMNPNKLVPTIIEDGFVLWESNSIVRYLAMKHGVGTLCPTDLQLRASAERWMDWQLTTLLRAISPMFHGLIRTPPEKRDAAAIARSRDEAEEKFGIMDSYLAKTTYIAGNDFTFGDIPLGIHAYRWFTFEGIERKDLKNLKRWYDLLCQRPAFREHIMIGLS